MPTSRIAVGSSQAAVGVAAHEPPSALVGMHRRTELRTRIEAARPRLIGVLDLQRAKACSQKLQGQVEKTLKATWAKLDSGVGVSGRLNKQRPEPLVRGLLYWRSARFLPRQMQPALVCLTGHVPRHSHLAGAIGERAVLDRVGRKFMRAKG
jgi:hypothetical protein